MLFFLHCWLKTFFLLYLYYIGESYDLKIFIYIVGLSKLLINEKLKQFRELINSYNPSPDKNCITIDDLRGFWDLVNIQIDDLNKKFNELDILKSNKWENKRLVLQTNQNLTSKCRRQNSCDKIHSEAAKSRLAAAKEKLQARMTKECWNNDEFYVY